MQKKNFTKPLITYSTNHATNGPNTFPSGNNLINRMVNPGYDMDTERKEDKEVEPAFNFKRVQILVYLEIVMIIDILLEGNEKIPSFIGLQRYVYIFNISRCSSLFWIIFIIFGSICLWYAKSSYATIRQEYQSERHSIKSEDNSEGFKIGSKSSEDKINKIIAICLLGGVISGMLGVGGGIVMAPLMLELGVLPRRAASTSNFLLMFTSSAASLLFILSVF